MRTFLHSAALSVVLTFGVAGGASAQSSLQEAIVNSGVEFSPRAMERLQAGERAAVIVILDVPQDSVMRSTTPDIMGAAIRDDIEAMARSVVQDASSFQALSSPARAHAQPAVSNRVELFPLTPGFRMQASASEIEALSRHPNVEAVFEDARMGLTLDETLTIVGAPAVWAQGFDGSGGAVAVLDTGVDENHLLTGPAITASACFNTTVSGVSSSTCPGGVETLTNLNGSDAGAPCTEDDFDPVNGIDGCFHGTHVASIAAGVQRSLSGGRIIAGVARGADIISVNVFSKFVAAECPEESDGVPATEPCVLSYTSDQIEALDWLFLNRVALNLSSVNMSLGGGENFAPCNRPSYSASMGALRNAGIAVVVASGNDGFANAISSPACVPEAISVGATSNDDQVPGFSNDADFLDLLAPGVSVLAAFEAEQPAAGQNCTLTGGAPSSDGFCHALVSSSGTSMATPHVAGAFAVLKQAFPSASVDDMLHALQFTGVPVRDIATDRIHARIQVDDAYSFLRAGGAQRNNVTFGDLARYDARNANSSPDSFNTVFHTLSNASTSARTVRVVSKPSWIETRFFNGSTAGSSVGDGTSLSINGGATGSLQLSINANALPSVYSTGEVVLQVDGDADLVTIPTTIFFTTPVMSANLDVRFGPFEWVGDINNATGSIFRIVGLDNGAPDVIVLEIERWADADGQTISGAMQECVLSVNPARYSGREYIIGRSDINACSAFDRGDIYVRVSADRDDVNNGLSVRRFLFNGDGGVTDASFDPAQGAPAVISSVTDTPSGWSTIEAIEILDTTLTTPTSSPQVNTSRTFGPFEWTYDGSGDLQSEFRISQIPSDQVVTISVAIANASQAGFNGDFNDCVLGNRAARRSENDFLILASDLSADCGAFGRADLTFRVTGDSSFLNGGGGRLQNARMHRFVSRANGSLSDLHFDTVTSAAQSAVSIGGGQGEVQFGPFEWTGDATTPTRNMFRIAGVPGNSISAIDVAITNSTQAGYGGDFNDCSITLRPANVGENDYLIDTSHLADCGNYGRGDLNFRIRGTLTDMAAGVKMRRLATGAEGDITDFGFDNQAGSGVAPSALTGGKAQVVFGPFEWVGDAAAGTRGVFRIVGINGGLPDRIDVAIANATGGNGAFVGAFSDCTLTLRPTRAGLNEFVISANDFADCGSFVRGDLSFRIEADASIFDATVRMRRFAVTNAGGLTDFGFDNE